MAEPPRRPYRQTPTHRKGNLRSEGKTADRAAAVYAVAEACRAAQRLPPPATSAVIAKINTALEIQRRKNEVFALNKPWVNASRPAHQFGRIQRTANAVLIGRRNIG